MTEPTCPLYLITPPKMEANRFADDLEAALRAGEATGVPIACLQLRLKEDPDEDVLTAAETLKPILSAHEVPLIINDRADLA